MSRAPLLYGPHAGWYHLLLAPHEYAEESVVVHGVLAAHAEGDLDRVLELGCGGGNLASHLTAYFEMTLTDISAEMVAVSESINPGTRHVVGDMRAMRLGETFDAVVIHDAIGHMTTVADLRAAIATAFTHLRPGGLLLVLPDFVRETFEPGTLCGGHSDEHRSARFLAWQTDEDPEDSVVEVLYAIIMRDGDGTTTTVTDLHLIGLFDRATWLETLTQAGFVVTTISDSWREDVYLARRPGM